MLPSTTHRAWRIQSTLGPDGVIIDHADLLVVARLPSSTPDLAARPAPTQIVMRYSRLGYRSAMKSVIFFTSGAWTPPPPGTKSTSSSGAVENVCVGRIIGQKLEFFEFEAAETGSDVTGSKFSAMKYRFIWRSKASSCNASRGPKMSWPSKERKSTTPQFLSRGVAVAGTRALALSFVLDSFQHTVSVLQS